MTQWKLGDELAPYHPQASHVPPDYRDGWNACYRAWAALAAPDDARVCIWDDCGNDAIYCEGHAKEYSAPLVDLLKRIRAWDMMDTAADGAYWRKAIDAAIAAEGKL